MTVCISSGGVVVLVTGGRNYRDAERVDAELSSVGPISLLIDGGATGADALAGAWAVQRRVPSRRYPARWNGPGGFNRRAGFERNQRMLEEGRPALVVAFPGGNGTADMVRRARRAGVPVREVRARSTAWDWLLG